MATAPTSFRTLAVLALGLFLAAAMPLRAQTTAYQSADGTSSIFLANAKANLVFNISNAQFSAGYLHEEAGPSVEYGFSFSGKPSSDLTAQIFQTGNSPASIGGGFSIGRHQIFSPSIATMTASSPWRDDWGIVNVTYTGSTFYTFPNSTTTATIKQQFNGITVLPTYNAFLNTSHAGLLLGLATGIATTNNLASLKSVTVDTPVSTTSATGATVVQTQSAYLGAYSTSIGAPLYSDFVILPKRAPWLAFDAFTRSNLAPANRFGEGGLGIFLARPKLPTQVLGGISLGWKNGARTIALVGGWAF